MSSADLTALDRSDELDLLAFIRVVLRYRVLIGAITAVCAIVAVIVALLSTPIYHAEVVLTEVGEEALGGGAGIAGQLGGLASLAGIKLQAGEMGQRARATLQSRKLIEEFINRHGLLAELTPPGEKSPTLWRAVRKFKISVLTIREDQRRGTITVGVDWRDPQKAARWANDLVALANEMLRGRATDEAQRNIAYLNKEIAATTIVEMQQVMYDLIESETKTLMLASGRADYAFAVVDPAVPPEVRIKPQRTLMVLMGMVFGLLLGTGVAFGHRALVAARSRAPTG